MDAGEIRARIGFDVDDAELVRVRRSLEAIDRTKATAEVDIEDRRATKALAALDSDLRRATRRSETLQRQLGKLGNEIKGGKDRWAEWEQVTQQLEEQAAKVEDLNAKMSKAADLHKREQAAAAEASAARAAEQEAERKVREANTKAAKEAAEAERAAAKARTAASQERLRDLRAESGELRRQAAEINAARAAEAQRMQAQRTKEFTSPEAIAAREARTSNNVVREQLTAERMAEQVRQRNFESAKLRELELRHLDEDRRKSSEWLNLPIKERLRLLGEEEKHTRKLFEDEQRRHHDALNFKFADAIGGDAGGGGGGGRITQRFAFGSAIAAGAAPAIQGVTGLAAAAISLGEALKPLLGLVGTLPAGFMALGQVLGVTGLAFNGMGAALKEITANSDDTKQATEDLQNAQINAKSAQRDLTAAREDARRALADLHAEEKSSSLSVKEAEQALVEARERVVETNANLRASDNDVAQAKTGVQRAELNLAAARTRAQRVSEDLTKAERKGVEGSDQVVSAKDRESKAQNALQQATRKLTDAQNHHGAAYEKLTPAARKFVDAITPTVRRFKELREVAQTEIFSRLTPALNNSGKTLDTFKTVVGATAREIGTFGASVARELGSPTWRSDIQKVGTSNAKTLGVLGQAAIHVARAIRDVAVEARPLVEWLGRLALGWSKAIEKTTASRRENGSLARSFTQTRKVIEQLLRIAHNLFSIFGAFSGRGKKLGDDMLSGIEKATGGWAHFLNHTKKGQRGLDDFFGSVRGTLHGLGELGKALGGFFAAMNKGNATKHSAFESMAEGLAGLVRGLTQAGLPQLLIGLSKLVAGVFSTIGGWLSKLAHNKDVQGIVNQFKQMWVDIQPFIENILKPFAAGFLVSLFATFKGLVVVLGLVAKALGAMGRAAAPIRPLFYALGYVAALFIGSLVKLVGWLGRVVGGVGETIPILGKLFSPISRFGGVLTKAGERSGKFFEALRGLVSKWVARGDDLVKPFVRWIPGVKRAADFVVKKLGSVLDFMWDFRHVIGGALSAVLQVFGKFGHGAAGAMDWVINRVKALIGWVNKIPFGKLKDAANWVKDKGGKVVGFFGRHLATGTITSGPEVALIGEAGEEVVIPVENNKAQGRALLSYAAQRLGVPAMAAGGVAGARDRVSAAKRAYAKATSARENMEHVKDIYGRGPQRRNATTPEEQKHLAELAASIERLRRAEATALARLISRTEKYASMEDSIYKRYHNKKHRGPLNQDKADKAKKARDDARNDLDGYRSTLASTRNDVDTAHEDYLDEQYKVDNPDKADGGGSGGGGAGASMAAQLTGLNQAKMALFAGAGNITSGRINLALGAPASAGARGATVTKSVTVNMPLVQTQEPHLLARRVGAEFELL